MSRSAAAASIAADLLAVKAQITALEREASAWDLTALSFLLELALAETNALAGASVPQANSEVSIRVQ